ncbi:N-acetylmuramoyl-L-alanine amidase [Streptococcus hyovaginalis]|uniref:N-acetylmuramoyl-L-alanine amidase n=1 Tax=Streptococcus hyovaginalis TaxID=149015 RepID=UPI0014785C1D
MTTAQEVVAYAKSKLNQKVTVPTNPYGGQCVAFIDHIVQHFSNKNLAYTNAIDCLKKAKSQGLEVIYNNPNDVNLIPKAGDFFVMSSVASNGVDYGHIGVVVSADTKGMTTLEQNIDGYSDKNRNGINDQLEIGGGGYVRNNKRSYAGVTGWFRLPYDNKPKPTTSTGAINHNGEIYSSLTTHFNPNVMYSNLSKGVTGYSRMKIDRIVIHHNMTTDKNIAMQTWYESSKNWTSAHYEIADNEIWGCVGEQYSAFHSGDSTMNRRSIGIEHVNSTWGPDWKISEGTYKSSAKLIADICKRYNIPIDAKHIIPHKHVSATECPGGIDMAKLIKMTQEVSNGVVVTKAATTQKQSGSFRVKVSVSDLNIRKSPSLKAGKNGVVKPGVYTITETTWADGYEWGKLKSGAGWIALKYANKI